MSARCALAFSLALGLAGCAQILGLDDYTIVGDAGQDAGPTPDAGRDAGLDAAGSDAGCATRYADLDEDNFGDPETATNACDAPADFVSNGDDCDDSDSAIHPGITETCDDEDEDCDSAVDEGLMEPLGDLVLVEMDYGSGGNVGADVVAHSDGFTVISRREDESVVRASFFDRVGGILQAGVFIEGVNTGGFGPQVRTPVATRFTTDGLDQIFIAWLQPDRIAARLCATDGSCAVSTLDVVLMDTTEVRQLDIAQLGDRVVFRWIRPNEADGARVMSFDPRSELASNVVTLPAGPGPDIQFAGLATVSGPEPYSLVGRVNTPTDLPDAGVPDGGLLTFGTANLLRVRGDDTLVFDEATDALPWDVQTACAAAGRPVCAAFGLSVAGEGSIDLPSLLVFESLFTGDAAGGMAELDTCAYPATPAANAVGPSGPCTVMPDFLGFPVVRGGVATVVLSVGTGYGVRDIPLSPGAEGGNIAMLPSRLGILSVLGSGSRFSMAQAHGAVLGEADDVSGLDLHVLPIGCMP